MGCTDPEGFGKWNPVFYPEKVGKGLTFLFFLKDRREDAAGFSKGVAASQRKSGHGNVLTGVC